ncbi:MAG: acyl-CoA dehydrogenase family protein, partial [Acidimicrobiaceae bacterium]|nr:acyl-CoA dehydrogenase family protein [Acidimicrobiaceae bacterium]
MTVSPVAPPPHTVAAAEDFEMIRTEVRRLCDRYGNAYWRGLEPDRYPEEFVAELTQQGWLGALIPEGYGGGGRRPGGGA